MTKKQITPEIEGGIKSAMDELLDRRVEASPVRSMAFNVRFLGMNEFESRAS